MKKVFNLIFMELILLVGLSGCSRATLFNTTDQEESFFKKKAIYNSFVQIRAKLSYTVCPTKKKDGELKVIEKKCKQKERKWGVGSGFGLTTDDNKEYSKSIVTAGHLCKVPARTKKKLKVMFMIIEKKVIRDIKIGHIEGVDDNAQKHNLKIKHKSLNPDICITEIEKPLKIRAMQLAEKEPERSEKYYNIAATLGIHGEALALQQTGFYSGRKKGLDYYTIPVAGGSSGSPILNSEGRVTGIVSMGYKQFDNITMSPSYPRMHYFLSTKL